MKKKLTVLFLYCMDHDKNFSTYGRHLFYRCRKLNLQWSNSVYVALKIFVIENIIENNKFIIYNNSTNSCALIG